MFRRLVVMLFATAIGILPHDVTAQASSNAKVVGTWTGKLDVGGGLTIVFHVEAADGGALKATMDSPDQGAKGIPVSEATFEDGTLRLVVAVAQGKYEGKVSDDGSKISGTWQQGGMSLPLELGKGGAPERKPRPQEPTGPLPYDATDVTFHNAGANIDLAGTLTVPRSPGPHPAVVLITGSGAQDRDESLLGHKPFLVLADHLTRKGIAVLRYDDRGTAKSGGNFATATSADFAIDALAAVAFLKTRPEIAPAKIGLIGHSEGGLIAPKAAAESKDVAFIVLMAGPGVNGEKILLAQIEKIARASGVPDQKIQKSLDTEVQLFDVLRSNNDEAWKTGRLREIVRSSLDMLSAEEKAAIGSTPAATDRYINAQIAQITSPWFRYFLTYEPRTALENVHVPVLALNGALDVQVPPDQSLLEIEAALKKAGNKDVTLRKLPGLNHLFQHAKTGAPAEYSTIDETISPEALDLMSSWILQRFGKMYAGLHAPPL
jgi:uncharacterized protein